MTRLSQWRIEIARTGNEPAASLDHIPRCNFQYRGSKIFYRGSPWWFSWTCCITIYIRGGGGPSWWRSSRVFRMKYFRKVITEVCVGGSNDVTNRLLVSRVMVIFSWRISKINQPLSSLCRNSKLKMLNNSKCPRFLKWHENCQPVKIYCFFVVINTSFADENLNVF